MRNNFNNFNNLHASKNRCNNTINSFSGYYKNTIDSLYCVGSFLDNFSNYYKYVRLYKLLK